MPMGFWGCRSDGRRGCRGDCTSLSLLMAWHTGCCGGPGVVTAQTVPCIHVLKNPQRAVPRPQNGAFFNLYADMKQGLRKRSLQGSVAQPKPNIGKAAPQGAQMNEIITEGVAKRPTMANGWVHDTYTPPTVTMSQLRLHARYAASKQSIMTTANCFHRIQIHK